MTNAIYKNKIYHCGEDDGSKVELIDAKGKVIKVPFGHDDLTIDPTDSEVDGLEYAGADGETLNIDWGGTTPKPKPSKVDKAIKAIKKLNLRPILAKEAKERVEKREAKRKEMYGQ